MIFFVLMMLAIAAECFFSGPLLAQINTEIVQGIVNHEAIDRSIGILFVIFVSTACFSTLQTVSHTYYKKYLTFKLQGMILKQLCHLRDYSGFHAGEMFAHIDQNAEAYCSERTEIIKKSVKAFCLILFSGIYMYRVNLIMLVFSYVLAGILIALNYMTAFRIGPVTKSLNEKSNELIKYRWEMIRNSEVAAVLADEKVLKKYLELNQEVYQLSIILGKKKLLSSLTKRYGYLMILAAVSIFGGLLSLNQAFTLAELFGVLVLLPRLTNSLFDVPKVLTDYRANQGLKKSIDAVFYRIHMMETIRQIWIRKYIRSLVSM